MNKTEGWVGIISSNKIHYFKNRHSLCGKYKYFGNVFWNARLYEPSEICNKCNRLLEEANHE